MKPLRSRLDAARRRFGLPWEVLERDYLLSWLLAGIDQTSILRESLVFKAGTALKKCFFGDYPFSEDLDFSGLPGAPTGKAMEAAVRDATSSAARLLNELAPVALTCERYTEKEPHPGGQEAFAVRAQLPWHRQPQARVIIEISVDERVLRPASRRPILHEYGEPLEASVSVYALEEIVAEKLRAILQHIEELESRGWSRSRARDYYDLWRILGAYSNQLDLTEFPTFLHEKCAVRNVRFGPPADFFQSQMLSYVEKTWEQWLSPLVPQLPSFETVIGELRPQIEKLLD
jgi:predicted nucleotidyltransferase component of viral defense system